MKKQIKDLIIILIISLLLLEATLRLLGYKPFYFPPFSISSEPTGALIPHSEMGLALEPGTFEITMNDSLTYSSKRLADSTRYTGSSSTDNIIIEFHGCSFTYGMAVNTEDAFAYQLQTRLKDKVEIHNKAVPGYGNIQGLISLKQRIVQGEKLPDTIIMFYASFHDERNALTTNYREHLYYGFLNMDADIKKKFNNASAAKFPYAILENGNLEIKYSRMEQLFKPLPLREYSAVVNLLQGIKNRNTNSTINSNEITRKILLDINRLCKEHEIEFILASIVKDPKTEKMLADLRQSISVLDMGLDILNDNQYNNQPYDSHPNGVAHDIYTERLYQYLNLDGFD